MKIKVVATSPKSAGIRSSRPAAAAAAAAAAVRATLIIVLVAADMFAARSAVAQQVASKAGRAPRVYNALITSDQRLLPSQADPIIAPVLRPFPFFYNGWPGVYAAPAAAAAAVPQTLRLAQQLPAGVAVAPDDPPTSAAAGGAGTGDAATPRPPQPAAAVKNNKPADTAVPDVPPPPLPVSRAGVAGGKDKKKPEEFPPAPVGFAI